MMANETKLFNVRSVSVIIFVTVFVLLQFSGSGKSKNTPADESSMAHIQCKEFVRGRLKAPSSAEFTFLDFAATKYGDNNYVIRSYVDAQNSFGAKLRNSYVCSVKWNGGSDSDIQNWELISLDISE